MTAFNFASLPNYVYDSSSSKNTSMFFETSRAFSRSEILWGCYG